MPRNGELFELMHSTKLQYKYAIRRLKRAKDKIQNDKFVSSIIGGGVNIFDEIKKFRGKMKTCSSRIDDEVGSENIANHFAGLYSELYNRVEQCNSLIDLQDMLQGKIQAGDIFEVNRVTEDVVKQALGRMKGGKNDAIFDFQSDCLVNGPPILVTHLANMIRSFLTHGEVPYFLLVCTLLPLVKDNLGDITLSDNYRAIASGSQILKLLDIVILILEGDKFGCDQLQFGFQAKSSTSMCSCSITAVIDYYNRQGSVVYGCVMDLSKAFDMVEWLQLFKVLMDRDVSPVFLRTLLCIYRNQSCDVRWNGSSSEKFSVSNGVRQGAVSSPIFFSLYINDLFKLLRISRLGCRLYNIFLGCFGYADDLFLLSASRSGLQAMVDICAKFAKKMNLKFSTSLDPSKSKTKCIMFSKKLRDRQNVAPVLLNGDPLPWVEEVKHLGNILESDNSMARDITIKRAKLIGKLNSLSQEFHYVSPQVFMKIINIYAVSFHGSGLWDIFSPNCERLYKAWNVAVRLAWNVPRTTHRYLIEGISGCLHPKVMLASRLVKFVEQLRSSSKMGVRVLASLACTDQRCVLGKTIAKVSRECSSNVEDLTPSMVKGNLKYFDVPEEERWRLGPILQILDENLEIPGFTHEETSEILDTLCTI